MRINLVSTPKNITGDTVKKIFWFAVSLGTALLLFCAVAFACILLSAVSSDREPEKSDKPITVKASEQPLNLLAVYRNEESVFACRLDIKLYDNSVRTVTVDLAKNLNRDPAEALDSEGLYPFIGKCLEALGESNCRFVVINRENFIKITDICGGMVYNTNTGAENLMTGVQADSILTPDSFTLFCSQVAETALDGEMQKIFSYLADNTQNNLSYPELYSAYR